jgi:DNA topoisomerase-1
MAAARLEISTLEVVAQAPSGRRYLLRASATRVLFPGFLALYSEGRDDEEERQAQDRLPRLSAGTALALTGLNPEQHFTQPPSRYTEASLIKTLEEEGIGRPSTYATIVGTLLERDYITREGRSLKPLALGETVSDLLSEHFPDIVDIGFTARMEEDLDEIARGKKAWVPVLRDFYGPFEATLKQAQTGNSA